MKVEFPELAQSRLSFTPAIPVRGDTGATAEPAAPAALDGRITLGGPVSVPLDQSYVEDDADLRAFVEHEATRYAYHLVHLSLTCAPEPASPRLEKAEVRLSLSTVGSAAGPIAWSMSPMRVTHTSQLTTTVQLAPKLKLLGADISLGSVDRTVVQQEEDIYLEGLNELGPDPRWELRRTSTMPLRGSHRLVLVVRAAVGAVTTIRGEVRGEVRAGNFLRRERSSLPEPLTVSAQLST